LAEVNAEEEDAADTGTDQQAIRCGGGGRMLNLLWSQSHAAAKLEELVMRGRIVEDNRCPRSGDGPRSRERRERIARKDGGLQFWDGSTGGELPSIAKQRFRVRKTWRRRDGGTLI